MTLTDPDGPAEEDKPAWRVALEKSSEALSRDLRGTKIDWDRIIFEMREERSNQLLESCFPAFNAVPIWEQQGVAMSPKESTISATTARVHFGEMMRRAENDETLIVERSGQPKAVIMSIETYRKLREKPVDQTSLNERILAAQARYLREAADVNYDVEEDIRQMREERSIELDNNLR